MDFLMNRIANSTNQFQGSYKRVLCVCSAGLLRSPTTALVLSQPPYNYNTRAAGLTKEFALVPVDPVLLHWADEIVCMNSEQAEELRSLLGDDETSIVVLDIEDSYRYRDPVLIEQIKAAYDKHLEETNAN